MSQSIYNPLNLNNPVPVDFDDLSDHEPFTHCFGEMSAHYGKTHSPETKKQISENHVGMKDKKHSTETKKLMSESAKNRVPFSAEIRAEIRAKIQKSRSGYKHSLETRKKMSDSQRGKVPWNKGIPQTDEVKEKLRKAMSGEKHHMYGKKHSAEALENMSGQRGPQKKTTCPHCLQIGGGSMMKRWHFNNCREIS